MIFMVYVLVSAGCAEAGWSFWRALWWPYYLAKVLACHIGEGRARMTNRWIKMPGPGEFRGEGEWVEYLGPDEEWEWHRAVGMYPTAEGERPVECEVGDG